MMRNIIALTMIFSLIGSFAGFTIVSVLTNGGRWDHPVLGTSAFLIGIMGGNLPMGASVSLFMVPVLAAAAIYILRGIAKREVKSDGPKLRASAALAQDRQDL